MTIQKISSEDRFLFPFYFNIEQQPRPYHECLVLVINIGVKQSTRATPNSDTSVHRIVSGETVR